MAAAQRNPEQTRRAILEAAFWEIHRHGFQAASIDSIIKNTGVTKGALYHHFPNKLALGYAVVEDVIAPHMRQKWDRVEGARDPITALQVLMMAQTDMMPAEEMALGCPLNNLAQEMSTVDEGFRIRIEKLFNEWRTRMTDNLQRAKDDGIVAETVDVLATANFIIASIEGGSSLAKNSRDVEVLKSCCRGLCDYLDTLRAVDKEKTA